jgi:hypothetical protein
LSIIYLTEINKEKKRKKREEKQRSAAAREPWLARIDESEAARRPSLARYGLYGPAGPLLHGPRWCTAAWRLAEQPEIDAIDLFL